MAGKDAAETVTNDPSGINTKDVAQTVLQRFLNDKKINLTVSYREVPKINSVDNGAVIVNPPKATIVASYDGE